MHIVDLTMFYCHQGGGVTSYIDAKARWCANRPDMRHTVVSPGSGWQDPAASVVATPGWPIPGVASYRIPVSAAGAARAVRLLRPDIVEAGDACVCAWAAVRVKHALGIPIVAFCYSDLPQLVQGRFGKHAGMIAQRYLQKTYRHFDLVLAPSRTMVERLGDMGVAGAIHQPLGVDTQLFHPRRCDHALRRQLGLRADARLLVYAGRFTPEKNLQFLVSAVKRLGAPYHLVLLGSGRSPPASSRVTIMPYLSEPQAIARLLASCDLMVHAGQSETFGLAVIEAMACGVPVVAPGAGGIAELVDEQVGILTKPGDMAAFCEGIAAVFDGDAASMGAAARRRVIAHYDWNQVLPQIAARYESIAGRPQRQHIVQDAGYVID